MMVRICTPALTATYTDADGGSGTLYFEILTTGGTLDSSGSKTVASGSAATWSPTGAAASQKDNVWRVHAYDGTSYSPWTTNRVLG